MSRDLIARARDGGRPALEELVRLTIDEVRTFLIAVSPPGAPIDDLVQETYLTAYTSLARFDPAGAGTFVAWVCGIGRNLLRRQMRLSAGEQRARDALRDAPGSDVQEEIVDLSEEFVAARAVRLQRCLGELPEPQRELVALRYGHGMSFERIARVLGRPAGWARTTLHRARRLLRRCIERAEVSGA